MHYFLSAKFISLKIRLFEDPESGWAFLHQRWIGHIKLTIELLQGGGTDEERPSKYKNCIKGSKSNRQDLHPLRMIRYL